MGIITGSTVAKNISTNNGQPRFAKVEVVDQFGNRKIANIPVSELNRMKRPAVQMGQNVNQGIVPKKEKIESENFFVGGEQVQDETQKDIKVEMVDEQGDGKYFHTQAFGWKDR